MMAHAKLWTLAVASLFERYWQCWRQAWSIRHQLDGTTYRREEAEFLASALALEKTPVSPAPRITIWMLIVFCLIALLWSVFGKVDIVASAMGKIVASGRSKTIQAIETASVKAIPVHEGDAVKAGDLLLELDATDSSADATRLGSDLNAARLQAARARALLSAQQSGQIPVLPIMTDISATRMNEAERQVQSMFSEYRSRLERIEADIERRQAELQSTLEIVRKLEQTFAIVRSRAQDFKNLSERSFVSRHAWMEKEQIRIEQEGELAMQRSRLAEIKAALREAQGQRHHSIAEMRRQMLDAQAEGELKSASLQQDLIKAESRQRLMRIVAPIDGTVQQLAVNTTGGVVTPAQALMLLVPINYPMEVEARIENKDIGFVKAGQDVEIKIETFNYTRYGTIKGRVINISQDAVNDDRQGLVYLARIKLENKSIQVDQKTVPLSPGMIVIAEIKTGRRKVIDYFLSPLMQHASESLRER